MRGEQTHDGIYTEKDIQQLTLDDSITRWNLYKEKNIQQLTLEDSLT